MGKVFVQVTVEHDVDGKIRPLTIKWEDGRIFAIDRLLDVCLRKSGAQTPRLSSLGRTF